MTASLGPPAALVTAVGQAVGVVPQIDALVASLQVPPPPSCPAAPTLPADLRKTSQDAATWTARLRPAVCSALAGVKQFSVQFDASYAVLDSALTAILAGDPSAISAFQDALAPLQSATKAQIALVSQVQGQITEYDALMDQDLAVLNGEQSKLDAAMKSDQQEIEKLEHDIKDLEHDIDKKKLPRKRKKLEDQLDDCRKELNDLERDASTIGTATHVLSTYSATVKQLSGAAQGLSNGWASLDANFQVLLESEEITTFNSFTNSLLAAMRADWANLAAQAASLV